MAIYSSSDVSAESLLDFVREAGSDLKIEIAEEKFHKKAPEAESLIALLGRFHGGTSLVARRSRLQPSTRIR